MWWIIVARRAHGVGANTSVVVPCCLRARRVLPGVGTVSEREAYAMQNHAQLAYAVRAGDIQVAGPQENKTLHNVTLDFDKIKYPSGSLEGFDGQEATLDPLVEANESQFQRLVTKASLKNSTTLTQHSDLFS